MACYFGKHCVPSAPPPPPPTTAEGGKLARESFRVAARSPLLLQLVGRSNGSVSRCSYRKPATAHCILLSGQTFQGIFSSVQLLFRFSFLPDFGRKRRLLATQRSGLLLRGVLQWRGPTVAAELQHFCCSSADPFHPHSQGGGRVCLGCGGRRGGLCLSLLPATECQSELGQTKPPAVTLTKTLPQSFTPSLPPSFTPYLPLSPSIHHSLSPRIPLNPSPSHSLSPSPTAHHSEYLDG